jgi:hypothetical protein
MATVTEMKQRFQEYQTNLDTTVHNIIDQSGAQAIKLVQGQLSVGYSGTGKLLDAYKSKSYAQKKISMGSLAPFGVPNLKYSGSFYQLMFFKWNTKDEFFIGSDDKKWFKLLRQYGNDTLKLQEASLQDFIDNNFRPQFIQSIRDYTGAQ